MKTLRTITYFLIALAFNSPASVITFEGFATSGSIVNVNPNAPYQEAGYTLRPLNVAAAVFGPGYPGPPLPGDETSTFGFSVGNTLTLTGPVPFDLNTALIGRLNYAAVSTSSGTLTIVGNIAGGGTLTVTIPNLGDAAQQVIGMTNLRSAFLTATNNNVGMDNISVTATIPEPPTCFSLEQRSCSLSGWPDEARSPDSPETMLGSLAERSGGPKHATLGLY